MFGPAVVIASRLCGAAAEHQILATDMVRMLAGDRGGHHYEPVGDLILKGIAEPVSACTVQFEIGAAVRGLPTPLAASVNEHVVGREEEMEVLVTAYKAALAGEGRAVLVAGEPGVGKTRLVAALARRAHDDGALVLFGRCAEDVAVAYQPFVEALQTGLVDLDPAVLAAHVAACGGEIRRLVPAIDGPEPVAAEAAVEQARLFDAVADLLRRAAADRTVVLVLDDVHWATAATVALLRKLLNDPQGHRLCVLATYRDTEIDRSHALGGLLSDIHRTDGAERLALRGLDRQGVEDLFVAVSGDELEEDGVALAAAVLERTSGNPFFVNQVLRHLVERGVLHQVEGRWNVVGELADLDLPEGVLDVVGRRLSRLSPAANQAMSVAALCGLAFSVRVLSAVPDAGDPDAVIDGLDEAVRARLLVETAPGQFAFAHAIVRDALTRELTSAKRARLHRAIGEGILVVYGDAPTLPLAELTHHFTEAAMLGDTTSAAAWAVAAADAAADRSDQRGAIAVLERALTVIEAVEPVNQAARFDVAVAISERHYALAEFDLPVVDAAADAARRLRSGERMLRIAAGRYPGGSGITDPQVIGLYQEALELLGPDAIPLRTYATAGLAGHLAMQGDPSYTTHIDAVLERLPELDEVAPRLGAGSRMWAAFAMLGLPGAGRRLQLIDEALAVPADAQDPWLTTLGTRVDITQFLDAYRAHDLIGLGRRSEFQRQLARLNDIAESTGNMSVRGIIHAQNAMLSLLEGRFEEVETHAGRMMEASPYDQNFQLSYFAIMGWLALEEGRIAEFQPMMDTALQLTPDLPAAQATAARAHLEMGDHGRAEDHLRVLLDRWSDWARDWSWPLVPVMLAEVSTVLSDVDAAQVLIEELELYSGELAIVGGGILCCGAFDRFRGMLLDLTGRSDDAVAALDAALALEDSLDAAALTARTRYWLAVALRDRAVAGDLERAATELTGSIQTAERLGMTTLARDGHRLTGVV